MPLNQRPTPGPSTPQISGDDPAFWPSFVRLAAANMISNLMVPLAGLVDTAFLGHLDDIRHLGGVALATVIFNVVYWSFGFLRMGTTGTTAQARGRGDREELWLILLRNGAIALTFGLVILLLQVPIRDLGFTLLSAEPGVREAGIAFYNAASTSPWRWAWGSWPEKGVAPSSGRCCPRGGISRRSGGCFC